MWAIHCAKILMHVGLAEVRIEGAKSGMAKDHSRELRYTIQPKPSTGTIICGGSGGMVRGVIL